MLWNWFWWTMCETSTLAACSVCVFENNNMRTVVHTARWNLWAYACIFVYLKLCWVEPAWPQRTKKYLYLSFGKNTLFHVKKNVFLVFKYTDWNCSHMNARIFDRIWCPHHRTASKLEIPTWNRCLGNRYKPRNRRSSSFANDATMKLKSDGTEIINIYLPQSKRPCLNLPPADTPCTMLQSSSGST